MPSLHKAILASTMLIFACQFCRAQEFPDAAEPQTLIYLNSQPGDWVGQGQQFMFTPADGTITVQGTYNSGIQASFTSPGFTHWFYLNFGPPVAQKFVKGAYVGAQRFAFHSPTTPGLDVYGDGRGCNTIAGQFLVEELVFNNDGSVARLSLDFEQHCDGAPPALFGSVRFNSKFTLAPRFGIGDTTLLKGNAGTNDGTVFLILSMPSTSAVSVQYATQDGSAVQGVDYVASSGTVTLAPGVTTHQIAVPILGDRTTRTNKTFKLVLSQPNGAALGDGSAKAQILSPNGSLTVLSMYGQPGDYISPGQLLRTAADGVFTPSRNFDQGVSIALSSGDWWNLDFAAPDMAPLGPGDYENAQRFPFQPAGVPGLSVYGSGRGCNTLTGRFTVLSAAYDSSGNVLRFAADFEQHCEGGGPALNGSVRYKSPLRQISVSNAVVTNGVATFTVTLNPSSKDPVAVAFSTADGTAVAGVDYVPVTQTVTFSPGVTSQTVAVQLLQQGTGKQFMGTLSSPGGAALWISQSSATIQ